MVSVTLCPSLIGEQEEQKYRSNLGEAWGKFPTLFSALKVQQWCTEEDGGGESSLAALPKGAAKNGEKICLVEV